MKIGRGFVKTFLFLFFILILGVIISSVIGKYQVWMGYTLIGFLIFLALLFINKKSPGMGKFLIFLFFVVIIVFVLVQNVNFEKLLVFSTDKEEWANVTRVISGDRFEINENKTGRLMCVNTPQSSEEGFRDSRNFLRELILDREVRLEKADININDSSIYGAYYVYVNLDGIEVLVNREIVKNGFGNYSEEEPDSRLCKSISE